MINNLLRCDLSVAQLNALAESKGQWWLLDDVYYLSPDDDNLLQEWNGFKFYQVADWFLPEEGYTIAYAVTPQGYYLAVGCSCLEEIDEGIDILEQVEKQLKEIVEDAIATILSFPESQGQLSLFETEVYVAN